MDTSKIIKGVVNSGRYTVTAPIVKEDYGLYLKIEGVELPSTYEVDFSNSENNGTSVTMIGNSDGVLIPRQFIDSGKDVFAFLYHVGQDFGRTVYKFRIPNKVRPDRTNEQPTPEEQSVIDQAIGALNEAVAQTAQDVISADQSAQSAQGYAEQAEDARDNAQTYANNASASATSASQSATASANSATASAQSASQSAQIKSDVEDLVDDARGYASASAQSASASANSASQASGYAQSASASANSASGYASQADISANTASAKAQDASTSAQTASAKATESAQSASLALGYKNDAESAKTASQTAQGLAESARDSAISAKTDAESAKDDAVQAKEDAESAVASISGALADKADVITDTASGAVASFSDGADNLPLKSLIVDINPIQDLSHGDPSPENICPISGWTEVNVNHSDADMTNPTTITISLGQTVYGGKLDVLSGVLTVDSAMVDLGTLNWSDTPTDTSGIYRCFSDDLTQVVKPFTNATVANAVCSHYKTETADNTYLRHTGISIARSGRLSIYDSRYTAKDDIPALISTLSGIMLCYELAEPIEIQLTPNQVNSLLGVNNIWADSGDTEVVYRADTKLYIERLTAPDSADMVADANITSGQYFMVGNSLYKATANIANDGQIIVGTNATRVSLAQALNEINV